MVGALLGATAPPAGAMGERRRPQALEALGNAPSLKPGGAPQVVLDPGHGGEDLGAVVSGRREKDIALSVARRLRALLEDSGAASVKLTRETDTFIQLDERVNRSLLWGGKVFISLHVNQIRQKKLSGITIYAYGRSRGYRPERRRKRRLPPLPAPPRAQAAESAVFASIVTRSFRADGFKVDPPGRAAYYVLKNPALPSILVELGYLSNPAEAKALEDPAYQERLARTLAAAVQEYLDGVKRPPDAVAVR